MDRPRSSEDPKRPVFQNAQTVARLMRERQMARIGPQTAMQCGVCWHVYDPAEGDTTAGVPPQTSFLDLPVGWSCPQCGVGPERFLVVDEALTP